MPYIPWRFRKQMVITNAQLGDFTLSETKQGIIRTLLYFDIFDYPLTEKEIIKFHPHPIFDQRHWLQELGELVNEKMICRHHHYFSMRDDIQLISRRLSGNTLAIQKLPTARKYGRLISWFPFVRGVMISGSLSKDYMDEKSDVDFFIVTEPERLWLTKALLAIFKRVVLFNSHKFFCTNYFIDTLSLEIQEKNFYTAFETATLIPVSGESVWNQFHTENGWLKAYFPNLPLVQPEFLPETHNLIKSTLEKILSGNWGKTLDSFFMRLTIKRWKNKFGNSFLPIDFNIAFKSDRNVSKSHPNFYQKRVLSFFQQKVEDFEVKHDIKLES